ncbi:hypothetical protein D7316_05446 [Gordonia insulae]|uniref:Phospholipase A2 n=2 Tax=Gordonia insulae TaxID=2420509 RepID=A0A3G8JVK4_9ACTN|nr:hypothetical protein D7316_05446 [Gordonia insulae]
MAIAASLVATATTLSVGFGVSTAQSGGHTATPDAVDASTEATPDDLATPAGRVVWELTGPHPESVFHSLPKSFSTQLGYRPRLAGGYPVDPTGDCSSPIALPRRFDDLCRTHDFGYDVLRFASRDGHPLGGWARLRLDRMLIQRMHASCSSPICDAAAALAEVGLRVNTWRQFDGAPTPAESPIEIVSSGVGRGWADLTGRRSGATS